MAVIDEMRAENPSAFQWKPAPYEYEQEKVPIDVIAGAQSFRHAIDFGARAEDIAAKWEASVAAFSKLRTAYLLY